MEDNQISQLAELSKRESRIILGLMSGTSMDGLDMALCRITGIGSQTEIELQEFSTRPYSLEYTEQLKDIISVPQVSLQDLCVMNTYMGDYTASCILEMLDHWGWQPEEVDIIASHGQTIYHAPKSKHGQEGMPNATLQMGDGDHIAHNTGILTVSDFRQKHTAAGGEGAPLAALIDRIVFVDSEKDRILLNIGGIANFTFVQAASSNHSSLTADTGPGNTLMNEAAQRLLGQPFDDKGETARSGETNSRLLKELKSDRYFDLTLPKTTGLERFSWDYVQQACRKADATQLPAEDLLATLTTLTADTIAEAIRKVDSSSPMEVLVTGGGLHNSYLMELLQQKMPDCAFKSFSELYFNPDAKEAACFA